MKVVFNSGQSLHSMETNNAKGPLIKEKQAKVVHQISHNHANAYIGETLRRIETRVKEHQAACQNGALQNLYAWENQYPIKWEDVTVVPCYWWFRPC